MGVWAEKHLFIGTFDHTGEPFDKNSPNRWQFQLNNFHFELEGDQFELEGGQFELEGDQFELEGDQFELQRDQFDDSIWTEIQCLN